MDTKTWDLSLVCMVSKEIKPTTATLGRDIVHLWPSPIV